MFNRLKGIYSQSEFLRNVLTLTTGTAFAQVLPIMISPFLTRLYSPEQFATFGLFSALVSIMGVISTGKYEFALLLPKDEEQVKSVAALAFIVTCALGTVSFLIVLLFHDKIVIFFNNPDFALWLYFVPLGIVLTGFYQILNFLSNRKKSYKQLAKSRVARALAQSSFNLIFGFLKFAMKSLQSFGLIVGSIIGQATEIVMLMPHSIKRLKDSQKGFDRAKIRSVARRYINFPRYDVPSELMITTSIQLPVLLLNRFFTQSAVGFYFHAHKILSIPLSMLGSAIGQVLFKQLSDCKDDDTKFTSIVRKTYANLALLAIVPFSIVACFGREIFGFVFGDDWAVAGVYASLISPWLFFNFIGSPLTIIFSVLERQKQMFYWITAIFSSRLLAILIGIGIMHDVYHTILLFSISGAISYFLMNFYMVTVLSGVSRNDFIKSTFGLPLIIVLAIFAVKALTLS